MVALAGGVLVRRPPRLRARRRLEGARQEESPRQLGGERLAGGAAAARSDRGGDASRAVGRGDAHVAGGLVRILSRTFVRIVSSR